MRIAHDWSYLLELHQRPQTYKDCALLTELKQHKSLRLFRIVERLAQRAHNKAPGAEAFRGTTQFNCFA